ncbi:MAG: hypothetical protein IVW55_07070 [Chloroflexi bacterium]|nr:hypothetical protein [Chloroflexota bacterium]
MSNEYNSDAPDGDVRVLGQAAAGEGDGLSLPPRPDAKRLREARSPRPRGAYTPDYVPPEEGEVAQGRDVAPSPYTPEEEALTTTPRRSAVPVILAVVVALIVIVGTIVATVYSSMRSSGGALPGFAPPASATVTPDPAKAADILSRSVQAMKSVLTLHYTSDAGFYGLLTPSTVAVSSTGVVSLTLSGDVKLPDSYTMNSNLSQVGQYVVISDTTWSRRNNNPSWVSQPTAEVGLGPVNPLDVILYLQDYKEGTQREVGTERADGVLLHHVRYKVDVGRLATDEPGQTTEVMLSQSSIDADVWIRDNDLLLDRMSLKVETGDGKSIILRTFFSNYNQPVSVAPPQNSSP